MKKYYSLLIAIVLGMLALTVPLLRDFHLESALIAAVVGCFWAAWKSATPTELPGSDFRNAIKILGHLYIFGLPLLVYTLLVGCFSIHGLGFWLFYPIPSVFLGFAIGRLLRSWNIPYSRLLAFLIVFLLAFVGLFIEFYSFPQVYFFNHVWGWWPGPIYDEAVQLSGRFLYFRSMTFFWVLLLWFIPNFKKDKEAKWIVVLVSVALLLSYLNLSEIGLISPRSKLQLQLGGQKETEHFRLYYAKDHYSQDEIKRLALEHEFYLDQITQQLNLPKPSSDTKIESYLYAHPWQKKELVGAKFTSYVPVWLDQDQLHIAKQQLDGSLKHELVHVLAKQFGNRLLNASWSIGLIEGLAVAVAHDESATTTVDQIVVSEKPYPTTEKMKQALSPIGFYGGRSAVNYTTTGSFVSYLLSDYPVEDFKEAYKTGDIARAYDTPIHELVQNWHKHLDSVAVDSLDERTARRLFSIPSLFEKECPRVLSDLALALDRYLLYRSEKDTASYIRYLDQAQMLRPENLSLKAEWSFRNLESGLSEKVRHQASLRDSSIDLQMLYADAFKRGGSIVKAREHMHLAETLLLSEPDPDSLLTMALQTRRDDTQWDVYMDMRYAAHFPDVDTYGRLLYRSKIRALQLAMDHERWDLVISYSQQLIKNPVQLRYFDTYTRITHTLVYVKEWTMADEWLGRLDKLELRQRYKERLNQQKQWLNFIENLKQ